VGGGGGGVGGGWGGGGGGGGTTACRSLQWWKLIGKLILGLRVSLRGGKTGLFVT